MVFPPDLPGIIAYRMGPPGAPRPIVQYALPRRKVEYHGSSGKTNSTEVCPRIPRGAQAWQLVTEAEWRPMDTIPLSWLPFLNRERPSEMDPRKPIGVPIDEEG